MSKLWSFGDSYTENFSTQTGLFFDYFDWKGYVPKSYSEIVSEKLNLSHYNYGKAASSNRSILSKFCQHINHIEENDVIIIGWTNVGRYRVFNEENDFYDIISTIHNVDKFTNCLSKECAEANLIVRDNPIFLSEIIEYMDMIEKMFPKNVVIFWSWHTHNLPSYDDKTVDIILKYVNRLTHYGPLEDIVTETKGKIKDFHYSENGHNILADKIIKKINNLTK